MEAPNAPSSGSPLLHGHRGSAATIYRLQGVLESPQDHRDALIAAIIPAQTRRKARRPLQQIVDVALEGGARCAVVEERYIDPDYRSEYSAFWSRRFEDRKAVARRVHFFQQILGPDQLHRIEVQSAGYLGYCVLRPTMLGPVGRTVLSPPPALEGATLATVREEPSLFGTPLPLEGVAFCQQDGEFLVCAHTAAWLAHYTAQARGVVARRPTADFAALPSADGSSRYRAVPSAGLTGEQLQTIFSSIGAPALLYDVKDLPDLPARLENSGGPRWRGGKLAPKEHQRAVRRERILRVVCRYLNSGCPVVVLTSGQENHAFTLVGWQAHGDGVRLIACDDQVGPYELIEDPLAEAEDREEWRSLMIPLPEKVFLTGERAEVTARSVIQLTLARQAERGVQRPQELLALDAGLAKLKGPVSRRTRLIEGREYKALVATQTGRSDEVVQLIRMAHLPHWIWLVELQDRTARSAREPSVLAEIVFDSTSHDDLPTPLLMSTKSVSTDLREQRGPSGPSARSNYVAAGTGRCWTSLITTLPLQQ